MERNEFASRAKRALECGGPPQDRFAAANLTRLFIANREEVEENKSPRSRGRARQHARRVRSPEANAL